MTTTAKTIEENRLEIVLLATSVLTLVTLLGVLIFVNLGPKRAGRGAQVDGYAVAAWRETPENSDDSEAAEIQQSQSFIDSVRRRSPPTPGNGTKELLTLRRRIQLWSAGDSGSAVIKTDKERGDNETTDEDIAQSIANDDREWDRRPERIDSLDLTNDAIAVAPPSSIPHPQPLLQE